MGKDDGMFNVEKMESHSWTTIVPLFIWISIVWEFVKPRIAPLLASCLRGLEALGFGEIDFWPIISSEELAYLENPAEFYMWTCVSVPGRES